MTEHSSDPNNATAALLARLSKRGIDYTYINKILQYDLPNESLRFAHWFKGRTVSGVLDHIDKWKAILKKDFVLALYDLKGPVERAIFTTEAVVWSALIEFNQQVGPWDVKIVLLQSGHAEPRGPLYTNTARELRAVHRETKEERRTRIQSTGPSLRRAFEAIGLWDQLRKGDLSGTLGSRRSQQGWPIYTRVLIPRLYEFMTPYYKFPGHHWTARHGRRQESKPVAKYPMELLQDMLAILQIEHPSVFNRTTIPQLRAVVRRHLESRRVEVK